MAHSSIILTLATRTTRHVNQINDDLGIIKSTAISQSNVIQRLDEELRLNKRIEALGTSCRAKVIIVMARACMKNIRAQSA